MRRKSLISSFENYYMMYYIYTIILVYITWVIVIEFFKETKWKNQLAIAMVLLVFVLRLLQIK
jgi:hypothetical protein